jgi:hypothetical protein
MVLWVLRYICLNPDCPVCTFSVLPRKVLRYCRFLWDDLLAVKGDLVAGKTVKQIAQVWHVGPEVIQRAAEVLSRLSSWIEALHREVTDGKPVRALGLMVKIITAKLGRMELTHRWYCHRYPRRFSAKWGTTQFSPSCQ